jgi:hypothetical protein
VFQSPVKFSFFDPLRGQPWTATELNRTTLNSPIQSG